MPLPALVELFQPVQLISRGLVLLLARLQGLRLRLGRFNLPGELVGRVAYPVDHLPLGLLGRVQPGLGDKAFLREGFHLHLFLQRFEAFHLLQVSLDLHLCKQKGTDRLDQFTVVQQGRLVLDV